MKTALIIVDMQNDFMPGGSLPITHGDEVIAPISEAAKHYGAVLATLDAHKPHHYSFASTYNAPVYSMRNGDVLWPDHCVVGTKGQELVDGLKNVAKERFDKGQIETSGYSIGENEAFMTRVQPFDELFFCGVAYDYCVKSSAIDTKRRHPGKRVVVLKRLCKSVRPENDATITAELRAAGVEISE